MFYRKYGKRVLDIILSVLAIIFLSPIIIAISISLFFRIGKPIIFKQHRPGKDEKIFSVYKFKTMSDAKDKEGVLLPDNLRISKIGKILRKTSLDELPQLFNVLKGDMSFIGPRPLSIHYLPHYNDEERIRNTVRPGMTGLAQINGRNNAPWDNRIQSDIEYVEGLSFKLDVLIFLKTFYKVIKKENVSTRKGKEDIKNFNVYKIVKEQKKVNLKEIGSYFEHEDINYVDDNMYEYIANKYSNHCLTISGRAAIEYSIMDIKEKSVIERVFMPSYSCISMSQPFLDHNIPIKYYDVFLNENLDIEYVFNENEIKENDIFLYMSYFGFNTINQITQEKLQKLSRKGVCLIEDITHSFFMENKQYITPNYQVASLRKWGSLASGGICISSNCMQRRMTMKVPSEKIDKKIKGMFLKRKYLEGSIKDKEEFLVLNASFDNDLIRLNYENKIDDYSIDVMKSTSIARLKNERKKNALYLANNIELKNIGKMLFTTITDDEVPLFFPLIIKENYRDLVRKELINRGIYLPVHWPERITKENNISSRELSIVIDQRYDLEDMKYIVDNINDVINKLA